MKVLWLASWYPSLLNPFNGDFVLRHAKAVSLFEDVVVLYVEKDEAGKITKSTHQTVTKSGRLTEIILYYYSPQTGFFGKLLSQWKYQRCFKKLVNEYVAKNGKPDLVHLHVGMKAGIIARWIKKKYRVAYLLTEHWTGLLPEATPSITALPYFQQILYKQIIKDATAVSAVSSHLALQIKKSFGVIPVVIPNVVDTTIFTPIERQHNTVPKFIHISGLSYQKNGAAILQAFKRLKDQDEPFQLQIFGSTNPALTQKVKELGLTEQIHFYNEIPQEKLVSFLQQSDALILYSHFETFGCVVIEAHACGVPVIASDIPALQELIEEGKNGMFAPANDAEALAEVILKFLKNRHKFHSIEISKTAEKFNYQTVGKKISKWYMQNKIR